MSLTGLMEVGGGGGQEGTQNYLVILEYVNSPYIDASTCISHRYLITKFKFHFTNLRIIRGRSRILGWGVLNCATESKFDHIHSNPAHSFHL